MSTNMQDNDVKVAMNAFRIPLAQVVEGETCEMRFDGPGWKRGFRYGKIWLADGDVVGRFCETTDVRIPEDFVHNAIDKLAGTLARGIDEGWPPAVFQDKYDDELDGWCYHLIKHRNDDGEPDPDLLARVRGALCLATVAKAMPSRPLSEIVVGYHALNDAGEIALECTRATTAWDHAHHIEKTGFAGVGVVFADGSVRYDDDLVRLPWLPRREPQSGGKADPATPKRSRTRARR